jgi:nicotinate-nucleotide adenylyltransferase
MMPIKINPAIGIYGGTFDPVHFGHLRPVLDVCESLQLEHIRFIPSFIPPHRETPQSSVEDRLLMLQSAISSEEKFVLDQREIIRQGPSYMYDTLLSLKQDFPNHCLCLILGLDAFININTWHKWEKLLSLCHLVVTKRPETSYKEIDSWPKQIKNLYKKYHVKQLDEIFSSLNNKIYFMDVTQLPISSSLIRHKLKHKQSIRYLLPDAVYDIITDNQLYS